MLLSVQTGNILDTHGIDEGFRLIAEAGFDGVDMNLDCFYPYAQIKADKQSDFFNQSDEDILLALRPYRDATKKYGLRILQAHAPFPTYVRNEATNLYVLEALKKTIMMCHALECENLVVHPGFLSTSEHMTAQEEWTCNLHMYGELIPFLKRYGVVCCLENMFSSFRGKLTEAICSDPDEANRYIDTLNELAGGRCFGFCLDTGHIMLLGKDLYRFIHKLGSRIQVLHVHDNDGQNDEHLFPYMGIVDWDRFCLALREIGYTNHLSFETFHAMDVFDKTLAPQLLSLLHATGTLFATRIAGNKSK